MFNSPLHDQSTGVPPDLIVMNRYSTIIDIPPKIAVTVLVNQAAEFGVYSQKFIYTPPYKPSKGKKNKFDRLSAIYSGNKQKGNKPRVYRSN